MVSSMWVVRPGVAASAGKAGSVASTMVDGMAPSRKRRVTSSMSSPFALK